jgi:hypothetical protein
VNVKAFSIAGEVLSHLLDAITVGTVVLGYDKSRIAFTYEWSHDNKVDIFYVSILEIVNVNVSWISRYIASRWSRV